MEHRRAVYKGWLLPDSSCSPFSVLIVGKFFHENKEADRVLSVPPATDPDVHPAQKLRRFCSITRSATLFFSLLAAVSFSPSPRRRRASTWKGGFSRSYVCERPFRLPCERLNTRRPGREMHSRSTRTGRIGEKERREASFSHSADRMREYPS